MSIARVEIPKIVTEKRYVLKCDVCQMVGADPFDYVMPAGWVSFSVGQEHDTRHVCGFTCLERYAVKRQCQEAPV